MKRYLLDTNAILRFLLNDNLQQAEEVDTLFQQAKNGLAEIHIPFAAIYESVFVLDKRYKLSKIEFIPPLLELIQQQAVKVEEKDRLIASMQLFLSQSISFFDAIVAIQAKQLDLELFTFDKKLKQVFKTIH
jgi:predicted nucleic-acid-binding protein